MGPGIVDRLDQLVDDMLRRRHVGIAHAEINDVGAARAPPPSNGSLPRIRRAAGA